MRSYCRHSNDKPASVANTPRDVAPARLLEQAEGPGSATRTEALYAQCVLQLMRVEGERSHGASGCLALDSCVRNGGRP